jgi:hypothetical protein
MAPDPEEAYASRPSPGNPNENRSNWDDHKIKNLKGKEKALMGGYTFFVETVTAVFDNQDMIITLENRRRAKKWRIG